MESNHGNLLSVCILLALREISPIAWTANGLWPYWASSSFSVMHFCVSDSISLSLLLFHSHTLILAHACTHGNKNTTHKPTQRNVEVMKVMLCLLSSWQCSWRVLSFRSGPHLFSPSWAENLSHHCQGQKTTVWSFVSLPTPLSSSPSFFYLLPVLKQTFRNAFPYAAHMLVLIHQDFQ